MAGKRLLPMMLAPPSRFLRARNFMQVCHIYCEDSHPSLYQRLKSAATSLCRYFLDRLEPPTQPENTELKLEAPQVEATTKKRLKERRETAVQTTKELEELHREQLREERTPSPVPKKRKKSKRCQTEDSDLPIRLGSGLLVKKSSRPLFSVCPQTGIATTQHLDDGCRSDTALEQSLDKLKSMERAEDLPASQDALKPTEAEKPETPTEPVPLPTKEPEAPSTPVFPASASTPKSEEKQPDPGPFSLLPVTTLESKLNPVMQLPAHVMEGSPEPMQLSFEADDRTALETCSLFTPPAPQVVHPPSTVSVSPNPFLAPVSAPTPAFGFVFGAQSSAQKAPAFENTTEQFPAPSPIFGYNPFLAPLPVPGGAQMEESPKVFGGKNVSGGFCIGKVKRRSRT